MALIAAKTTVDLDWLENDVLQLFVGTEDAADLASSTPAGGTMVLEQDVWANNAQKGGLGMGQLGLAPLGFSSVGFGLGEGELGFGALGINDVPRALVEHHYDPTDKCAALPVGVKVRDRGENVSAVIEKRIQLADVPKGARSVTIAGTGSPREARLTWTASADV